MDKIKSLPMPVKILLSMVFFGISSGMMTHIPAVGYISMFLGLYVIFETTKFELFLKIIIALVLGLVFSMSGLFEAADLIAIRPVGSKIFMNMLTMALVPLVFSSILTGVTSLSDIKKLNRIGMKTIVYYISTTAVAITIGLVMANVMQPGKNISDELRAKFSTSYEDTATKKVTSAQANKQSLFQTVQKIVPKNIVSTVSKGKPDMLALIFFAMICGIALLQMKPEQAEPVIKFFDGITNMTIKIVLMAMRVAPYGVFAIIASTIAKTQSTELLVSLVPFSICVVIGLLLHGIGTNALSLMFLSGRNPIETLKKMKEVIITAFSTASSGATMPFTLETTEKKLGVKSEVAGFVVPLGATINMDGTALFQGVSALFLANIYGIELDLIAQLTVIGMAVLASIGTAAVPGVGVVILTMILVSVGIPPEGILFILPVNNLLDMCRTSVNVAGDMTCAIYIDSSEKKRD